MYWYICSSISATTLLGGGASFFPLEISETSERPVRAKCLSHCYEKKKIWTCVEDLTQLWLGGTSCFSNTNPFNFWQPFAITVIEIYSWKFTCYVFLYALSVPANRIFQKQTVFVFTGSLWFCGGSNIISISNISIRATRTY